MMSDDVRLSNLDVVRETAKAYLFRQHQRGGVEVEFWIPKGQIGNNTKRWNSDRTKVENMDISIPEWLLADKEGVLEQ